MKKLLPSLPWSNGRGSILLFLTLALTLLFVACGDDDSSSFVEPEKESSSSEILSSSDGTSDGNGDKSSSSVSSSSTNSSSTDAKSSSSVTSSGSGGDDFLTLLVEDPIACDDEGKFSEIVYEKVPYRVLCQNGYLVYAPQSSSSSSSVKSSSSYFNMSKQYNDKEWVKYETFVDPRDNQEYRTIVHEAPAYNLTFVVFATNLNYGKMVTAETATYSDETVEKFCYNDDPWYCENGFGGLYTWSEAMGLPRACDTVALGSTPECPDTISDADEAQRQGICPEGWHVMNGFEWRRMPTSEGFGAKPILSQVFGGSDDIGLAVLLGGWIYYDHEDGSFTHTSLDEYAYFWVVEETSPTNAGAVSLIRNTVNFSGERYKTSMVSVRCVKDY